MKSTGATMQEPINNTQDIRSTIPRFVLAELRRWLDHEPLLRQWPAGLDPESMRKCLLVNRLASLMNLRLDAAALGPAWQGVVASCSGAYRCTLLRALNALSETRILVKNLNASGVAVLGCRGPFAGLDLYGDVGARYFSDIDLLIPQSHREKAWVTAVEAGYQPDQPWMPRRFFARHHLHLRVRHGNKPLIVELHWALDHPYKHQAIDYAAVFQRAEDREAEVFAWRQPCPVHGLIMGCVHAQKHCRVIPAHLADALFSETVLMRGWVMYWLDIALIIRKYARALDWDEIKATAQSWRVTEAMEIGLAGVERLWPGILPEAACSILNSVSHTACVLPDSHGRYTANALRRWAGLAALGGFRVECLPDLVAYVKPDPERCASRTRIGYLWQQSIHILRIGCRMVEIIGYLAWAWLVKNLGRHMPAGAPASGKKRVL